MATKQKFDKPLDIDKYLGKAKDRIHRVGIELEGGWERLPDGVNLTHDGSVRLNRPAHMLPNEYQVLRFQELTALIHRGTANRTQVAEYQALNTLFNNGGLQTGEIPSPPLELAAYPVWMRAFYPQHVNETCGLHVHLSFEEAKVYELLMVPSYPATIIKYAGEWAMKENLPPNHPIWPRIKGSSDYCKHDFYADLQARKTDKDHDRQRHGNRYTVVNFCYGIHSTAECRLLPMMATADLGIRAVKNIIDVTNAFLVANAKREEKVHAKLEVDGDDYREELIEVV